VAILVCDEHVEHDHLSRQRRDKAGNLGWINRGERHVGEAQRYPRGARSWRSLYNRSGWDREANELTKLRADVLAGYAHGAGR
jgi:hypothetical protein